MTTPAVAIPLPHAAPDARRDFKILVLFLIALQIGIVSLAARTVEGINATLRAKLPEASDTILREAPRPPSSRLALV